MNAKRKPGCLTRRSDNMTSDSVADMVDIHQCSLGAAWGAGGMHLYSGMARSKAKVTQDKFTPFSMQKSLARRFKHQIRRLDLILVCILSMVARCSCHDLHGHDESFSSSNLRRKIDQVERTLHRDYRSNPDGITTSHLYSQNSCRLSTSFHRVITTACEMCPLSKPTLCPSWTVPLTQGSGDRGCELPPVSGIFMEITGCRQQCQLTEKRYECCSGFWGPMCIECPGGSTNPCNGRGRCQGDTQATQCQCNPAFTGVSCELCARDDVYGPNCDQVCDCVYGVCNAGATGDGFCLCAAGYQGPRCDQAKISCGEPECHPFAICSPPVTDSDDPQCVCSPGYLGDGRDSCEEDDPCQNAAVCSANAVCTHVSPGKHTCSCMDGYYGDGVECYPVNHCQQQFSPCLPPSTKCVFDGPGQYHCECEDGYDVNCQLINLCTGSTSPNCPPHSICIMTPEGHAQCQCLEGFKGDGQACYGSIMEVLRDLNSYPNGPLEGLLNTAIDLLDLTMGYLLSREGLFTVFVPTDQAFQEADFELNDRSFRDVDFARYLMKLHTIPTHMDAYTLNATRPIYTLAGLMAEVTHKDGNSELLRFRLEGSNTRARLIHTDIPAMNGVIHITDRLLYEPAPVASNPEGSVTDILSTTGRFNQLNYLLTSVGVDNVIPPDIPYTILAPMNKAFNQLPESFMDHLMSAQGRPKLLALLRNHVIPGTRLLMQDIITTGHVISLHGSTTNFHIYPNGLIGMDGGANMTLSDIIANDGYIHSIDGLIIPVDIDPLIPHRCDIQSFILEWSPCSFCNDSTLPTFCPSGSTAVDEQEECLMETSSQGGNIISVGCQQMCNRTIWEPECCAGFYGDACHPCPGGFVAPCSGHGQCADSRNGSGSCSCNENFTGTACELCMSNLFGPGCNQTCTCLHGVCDDGPHGTGYCNGGCDIGFMGKNCNVPAEGCGPELHVCHEHAVCDSSGIQVRCICQAGYSGSGMHCEPLNRCHLPERGACHHQALCTYLGPGLNDCTCNTGWEGDGFECHAVDPCQMPNRGGCSEGAVCVYVSPGVNECYCNHGYSWNGTFCTPINPCQLMPNGGCHTQADCMYTGPGTSDCQCRDGYGGDGWLCYQNLPLEIATIPNLRKFYELIQLAGLEGTLATAPGLTVFTPNDTALELFEREFGSISPMQAVNIVRMHIVNGTCNERDLYRVAFSESQHIQSLFPFYSIQVHDCNHRLCVNDIPVEFSDIPATNGLIHIIGEVFALVDGSEQPESDLLPTNARQPALLVPFSQLIGQIEPNSTFYDLLQQFGLLSSINTAGAYTIFFPTNEAVDSFNASRITEDILQYHLVLGQSLSSDHIYSGMHIDSSLGHNYQLRFRKELGKLFVNNIPVTNPSQLADYGVIHMISAVLVPLPNRCDINQTTITQSACGLCTAEPECPTGTAPMLNPTQTSCQYDLIVRGESVVPVSGCRVHCHAITYIPECCSGFYGRECAECPGSWSSPCSNHGSCMEGINGTGTCNCFAHFTGTACELCEPGMFGPLCEQVCNCAHGRCREGLHGDGRCICNHGYTGVQCDIQITEGTRCSVQCDINAYCLDQHCICYQGYIGNGTHCTVYDPCSEDRVCSEYASCEASIGGQAECQCLQGYKGDGVYCEEVNPCLDGDDGGCHELAECIHTGPAMSTCHCESGYEGNGRTRCSPINPCLENNGGCSSRAHCIPTGPGLHNCTCFDGHIGNGLHCTGNIAEELALNSNVSKFFSLVEEFGDMMRVLGSSSLLTILVPNNEAFEYISQQQIDEWRQNNQLSRVLMNHVIACSAFVAPTMNSSTSLTTLSAQPIYVTYTPAQGVLVNRGVHFTSSDYVTSNGIMHTIDRILIPHLLEERPEYLEDHPLEQVAPNSTYSIFLDLMKQMDLLDSTRISMSVPITVFMPTNEAFLEMYPGKLDELRDPANTGMLREYLAYHIVPHRKIRSTQLAHRTLQEPTLQGSNITIDCQNNQGFFINHNSKIIDTETVYRDGVFYALDMVLEPPSIGGRCDVIQNVTFSTDCHACARTIPCPRGSVPVGGNIQDCFIKVGWYNYQRGCLRHCFRQEIQPNCCHQHYGADCRECPGGKRNPCSWHGVCDDGSTGTGVCTCEEGFTGVACELCSPGRFGPNCEECQCSMNGQCNDGISGTGSCFCEEDYTGTTCETRLLVTPVCNPYCHINAVCRLGNICECRPEYYGSGYSCTVINQCSFDNGGCSMFADCTQVDTRVVCHCRDNYEGDGYICQPIDPCMTDNGGCHQHATCRLTGPNSRSCSCRPPFQGDGLFCVIPDPPTSACTIDNGGCHENAFCFDWTTDPLNPVAGHGHAGPMGPHHPPPTIPSRDAPLDPPGLPPHINNKVRCSCKPGYVGTGLLCNGNAFETLASITDISIYFRALLNYAKQYPEGMKLIEVLKNEGSKLTLFIPMNSDELANMTFTGALIGNHIVAGEVYSKKQLETGLLLVTWSKIKLNVESSSSYNAVLINDVPVQVFDIPSTNGILHIMSGPINVKLKDDDWNSNNHSGYVSVSKLFAGILITVFVIIFIIVVGFVIFIKVRTKKRSGSRPVISRYTVNGGNNEGSVTFSRSNILSEDDEEEDSDMTFHNSAFRSPAYNSTDMDNDTVGFAELDFNRAY